MRILWNDTETVGLQGNVKLIQYSVDTGPVIFIKLFRGWKQNTLVKQQLYKFFELLDKPDTIYCGFNIQFDLHKLYGLKHELMGYELTSNARPVKPFKCKVLDLQVHAMLKSPLAPFAFNRSSTRSVAIVRRIPKVAQDYVAGKVLEKLKPLIPASYSIKIGVHKDKNKDLVSLSFKVEGRLSLKKLMEEYGIETIKLADVWPLPEKGTERPWHPYPEPQVHDHIEHHCDIVMSNPKSKFYTYSKLDILYLKVLYEKLGRPEPDYNSSCCHNLAYCRYFGFDVDKEALGKAEEYYGNIVESIEKKIAGVNLRSSTQRLALLKPHFPLLASTNKATLKKLSEDPSQGGQLAEAMLNYGPARQRLLQIKKVKEVLTGKAHPDLRCMGTATNRMAGTGGFNWQGVGGVDEHEVDIDINELDEIPEELLEAWQQGEEGEFNRKEKVGLRHAILTPCVGDWSSFEVRIAASVYQDKQLQEDLKNGVDLHTMGTVSFHPEYKNSGISYEQFKAGYHDNLAWDKARKGIKSVIFGSFYFCTAHSVANSLGILEGEAQKILDGLYTRYSGMKVYRKAIEDAFLTADVETWRKESVARMQRSLKDLTGFERRWDFEADVATALWELGHSQVRTGKDGMVVRSAQKGRQTINGAVRSALLGSAIAIQAAVSRQAGNMKIQATGASLNKQLQARIWEEMKLPTLQIHDELFPPHHPNFDYDKYKEIVESFEQEASKIVPMLKFDFGLTERWSDK